MVSPQVIHLSGRYEIVSLVGTLNPEAHLHICLADAEGHTVGGHVLGDLELFTTAEVVVGEADDLLFAREMDDRTGFPELVVKPRSQGESKDPTGPWKFVWDLWKKTAILMNKNIKDSYICNSRQLWSTTMLYWTEIYEL